MINAASLPSELAYRLPPLSFPSIWLESSMISLLSLFTGWCARADWLHPFHRSLVYLENQELALGLAFAVDSSKEVDSLVLDLQCFV